MISEKIAVPDVFYRIKQFKEIISAISILSALIGPVPILLYFHYHQFFPNMDLANFTLLFFYSFVLTLIILGLIYIFFCIAGIFWKQFLLTLPFLNGRECNNHKDITLYHLIIPFIIQMIAIFCIFLLHKKFNYENIKLILSFVLLIVASVSGFTLSNKFGLSKKSIVFYTVKIFLSLLISTVVFSLIFLMIVQIISEDNLFNFIICFTLSLVINTTFILLLQKDNIKKAVLIYIISVTTILGFTNRFPTIADNIIKNMYIGHYKAEEVYLTPQCCQKLQSAQSIAITPYCSLQNVHVLWNLGDQYFFKVEVRGRLEYLVLDKKQDIFNFPKEAEKIINKPS